MPSCAIANCNSTQRNRKKENISFHKFPDDPRLSKIWELKCKRKDYFDVTKAVLCSRHFTPEQFDLDLVNKLLNLKVRNKLKSGAVPSLELPLLIDIKFDVNRSLRLQRRNNQQAASSKRASPPYSAEAYDEENDSSIVSAGSCVPSETLTSDVGIQTSQSEEIKVKARLAIVESLLRSYKKKVEKLQIQLATSRTRTKLLQRRKQNEKLNTKNLNLERNVKSIFSRSQIKLLSGQRFVNWTAKDIAKSLSVASMSKSAYQTLRKNWKLPLPTRRTIQKWASNFDCFPGILPEILTLMKAEAEHLTSFQKLCIINFDEMKICSDVTYDSSRDMIVGPHKQVQVIIVNGLCMKWRQPIYYEFDRKVTKSLLFEVIRQIEGANYTVCGIVSDFGGTNRELWNELGVNSKATKFQHPMDLTREIFVFADAPHMIKLIRNHLLDDGWVLEDGTVIAMNNLEALLNFDCSEIKLAPKLTRSLLEVKGAERMRVSSATKLLSHHTAALSKKCFPKNPGVFQFFQTMHDYFDIFNSRIPRDQDKHIRSGFGIFLQEQEATLDAVEKMVLSMRCRIWSKKLNMPVVRKALLPCQHGMLASIRSLRGLHSMLQKSHNVSYIITRRLNQDPLESFFSIVRSLGNTNDNPSPASFRHRMKVALLGSKIHAPVGSNVLEDDEDSYYISAKLLDYVRDEKWSKKNVEISPVMEDNISHDIELHTSGLEVSGFNVETASLHYLAGYLAFVLKRKHNKIYGISTRSASSGTTERTTECDSSWIDALSRGGLMIPNSSLVSATERCEFTFRSVFRDGNLKNVPNISQKIKNCIKTKHTDIDDDIICAFTKVRIKIRLNLLNNSPVQSKSVMKRKMQVPSSRKNIKKVKQFIA